MVRKPPTPSRSGTRATRTSSTSRRRTSPSSRRRSAHSFRAGRRVGRVGGGLRATREPVSKRVPSDSTTVRAWAQANGVDVPARGRLPNAVRERGAVPATCRAALRVLVVVDVPLGYGRDQDVAARQHAGRIARARPGRREAQARVPHRTGVRSRWPSGAWAVRRWCPIRRALRPGRRVLCGARGPRKVRTRVRTDRPRASQRKASEQLKRVATV
jgi:hypothetical protein